MIVSKNIKKTESAVDGSHCIDYFFSVLVVCDETTKIGDEKTHCRIE